MTDQMAPEVTSIGVVGLGTMGSGIAELAARHGIAVVGVELDDDTVARARRHVEGSTARAVQRGKMTAEEQAGLLDRITYTTDLAEVKDCQVVVEAVYEQLDVKEQVFRALDAIVPDDVVLATNTSSLSVTELSTATAKPGRVVGMHFFNPAPVQQFVEVIRTVVTEPDVVQTVTALAERLEKVPVVAGDKAGFIANALLFGYLNHAASMFEGHYASREDIDAAMRFGCGYPMGPLALLDLIGLDTAYEILSTMYRQGRDRLHAPVPILKQMVTAGMLGRKTGRGFYTYEAPDSPQVVPDALTPSADAQPRLRRDIARVGVVGTGTMASGIVEVFAKAGYPVTYVGRADAKVAGVRASVERSLDKAIQRGKLEESAKADVLGRLHGTTSLTDLAEVDLVVEAIAEDLQVKSALFENLDEICKPGAVLATTTSSLPIISLASVTTRPQDVVGMHFFNPAPIMRLVEVVSTVATAEEVAETTRALCAKVGKHAVSCGDRAGFIVNALLFPYLNNAVRMVEHGTATLEDVDAAMKGGCNFPMGPFALLDLVGLDTSTAILDALYAEFRDPNYAPVPTLRRMVSAGRLGRKSGRGFYSY